MKMTPSIGASGVFVLKLPWLADANTTYEVIAVRSFEDIYKAGDDVYPIYYKPMGLVDGVAGFNFKTEVAQKPNIITLQGSNGSIVYVPDTYIIHSPTLGNVKYQHVVITASLGALPEHVDLSILRDDVQNIIESRIGAATEVKIMTAPSSNQPTAEQHEALEAARLGSITEYENDYTRIKRQQNHIDKLAVKVTAMTRVLKHNNLI